MSKKEEFRKLMDDLAENVFQGAVNPNVLNIFLNLHHQIEEQNAYIRKVEERADILETNLKFLIEELKKMGYLHLRERRKLLQRHSITQESLIRLLLKKKIITRKILVEEIRKLKKEEKP